MAYRTLKSQLSKHLLGSALLTAVCVSASAQPVQLNQITPDVDPGVDYRIVLEPVADPDDDRNALVNFAFELENLLPTDLELRQMTFSYFDAANDLLHQETVSPDQIAELLIHGAVSEDNWSFVGKNPSLVNVDWATFHGTWQDLEQNGYRLADIEVKVENGVHLYSGLFEPQSGPTASLVGQSWTDFLASWQGLEGQDYRMTDFETYLSTDGQTRLYAGLFEAGTYPPAALVGKTWSDFHSAWAQLEGDDYRLFDVETYQAADGTRLYSGLFRPGTGKAGALMNLPWSNFLAGWQDLEADGYRMIDFESAASATGVVYYGLFAPNTYPLAAAVDRQWDNFLETWQDLDDSGHRMFDFEQRPGGVNLYSGIFEPGPAVIWKAEKKILFMSPQAEFFRHSWPTKVTVRVQFDNAADFVFETPIEVYLNKNGAQSYPFPAKQSDLPRGHYWYFGARAGHEGPRPSLPVDVNRISDAHRGALWDSGGNFCFGQQYAWDLGVLAWDGDSWESGNGGDQNADRFIWGTPVYAVEDGEILYCYGSSDDNSKPGPTDSLVGSVPPGGNMYWIRHVGGEVALYAHLKKDSVPMSLCPTDGVQNPPVPVSKGDQLGLVGNSGQSRAPHLHFHIQDSWALGDKGQSMPTLFNNLRVGRPVTSSGSSWEVVDDESIVSGNERVMIEIDN